MSQSGDYIPGSGAGSEDDSAGERAPLTCTINGEELTEVITSDDVPDDYSEMDDNESMMDDMEEVLDGDDDVETEGGIFTVDQSRYSFGDHSDSVYCVRIHPHIDGLVITGGGDDKAYIWRYDSAGQAVQAIELAGHSDSVATVGFNYDGKFALTGAYDGLVKVWDVQTGALVCQLEGPEDVEWCQWHGKGNAIVAGSADSTVWMWLTSVTAPNPDTNTSVSTGQCVQVFAGHDGAVSSGCFTSDGKAVCSGGEDGSVRIWAPKTGICKHVFEGHSGHSMAVNCMSTHSSEPELLLTGSMDGSVLLLQINTLKVLQTFVHCVGSDDGALDEETMMNEDQPVLTSVECVGFCPAQNIKLCASGGVDGSLKIWDYGTGLMRCDCKHGDVVTSLKWHATLPLVVTSSADLNVRVWDARNGTCLQEFTGHRNLITALDIHTLRTPVEMPAAVTPRTEISSNSTSSSSSNNDTVIMPPIPPTSTSIVDDVSTVSVTSSVIETYTDVIISTSDDASAKVFYFNASKLLA